MAEFSDFFDYLEWRGDLTLEKSPFNAVDALILCQIAYLDLTKATAENRAVCLRDAARLHGDVRRQKVGLVINEKTAELFFRAAESARFGGVMMTDVADKYDEQSEEQFSAITFIIEEGTAFIAFRGTDDTIVGWKEDFNLAFADEIPAQKDALLYAAGELSAPNITRVYIGGHSKGGNLALYAAAHVVDCREKVCAVFNFDGPGFTKETLSTPQFKAIEGITHSFYPQLSIIGQLFSHFDDYCVVKSSGQFLMQHDPFTWHLRATGFEEVAALEAGSIYFYQTFNEWFAALEKEKRAQFVNALFAPLAETDCKSLSALSANWLQASSAIMKAVNEMDSEVKAESWKIISSLFAVAQKNFGVLIAQK